ncbi:MAG TPA: GTPase ObgE [Pseudomonadota bacterium]|nr:GTPase ObgE [Pseudomonadota bacterium]
MQFVDECTVFVRGGDGGDGCMAFCREPGRPRGGPAGGDGGHGGSVVLRADPKRSTLLDLVFRREYRAERGESGQGRDRCGRSGNDVLLDVPVGAVVKDEEGHVLCDLSQPGQRFVAAQGGQGGRGNIHFATSTWQAPEFAEPGTPGQERTLVLELKLLADVGLLGFPNVGKSSLIARVSRVRPKIANYPFTTLIPNLGVVSLPLGSRVSDRSFVLADVPGLIEGAHRGLGLGHRFLRHLQRTRVLIHLLEVTDQPDRQPLRDFFVLNEELRRFDPALAARPQLVALTKMDLPDTRAAFPAAKEALSALGQTLWPISAATGEGVADLMTEAYRLAKAVPAEDPHPMMAEAMSGQK